MEEPHMRLLSPGGPHAPIPRGSQKNDHEEASDAGFEFFGSMKLLRGLDGLSEFCTFSIP